eukprot:3325956-Rhodomonas_salina.5
MSGTDVACLGAGRVQHAMLGPNPVDGGPRRYFATTECTTGSVSPHDPSSYALANPCSACEVQPGQSARDLPYSPAHSLRSFPVKAFAAVKERDVITRSEV